MRLHLFFLIAALSLLINVNGQTFNDEYPHLIDETYFKNIELKDEILVDSLVTIYHQAKEPIKQFENLEVLIENLEDLTLAKAYNSYLLKETKAYNEKQNENSDAWEKAQKHLGIAIFNIGFYYDIEDNVDEAINYYNQSLKYFKNSKDNQSLGETLSAIGTKYLHQGDYTKGFELIDEAVPLLDEDNINSAVVFNNIGQIHYLQENHEEAFYFFNRAEEIAKKKHENSIIAQTKSFKASVLRNQGKLDLAEKEAREALNLSKTSSDNLEYIQAYLLDELGHVLLERKKLVEAKKVFTECLVLAKSFEMKYEVLISETKLAEIDFQQGNIQQAKTTALSVYKIAKDLGDKNYIGHVVELLTRIEEKQGDYQQAFDYQEEYYNVIGDIKNEENKTLSVKQQLKYQHEKEQELADLKHQQELALETKKREQQKWLSIIFGIGLLAFGGLSAFTWGKMRVIKKQKIELDKAYLKLEESKKNELAISNLKALQSQMNPHFIFNALNSVQDLVLLKDVRSSNKFLGKFSDLIRKILLSSKEQFISLAEEIEILELYLDLEKLRFGEEFKINFNCHFSEKEQEKIKLPAMFIQPYIENAIKHGLFHKKGEKRLIVNFSKENNYLKCIVEDNGIGQEKAGVMKEKHLHLHTGFSTDAIKNRIRLLNETLGDKIILKTEDLVKNNQVAGTRVTLLFPI